MFKRGIAPLSNPPLPLPGEGDKGDGVSTNREGQSLSILPCVNLRNFIKLFIILYHLQKLFKKVGIVQGAGGGFGVVLNGEDRQLLVA